MVMDLLLAPSEYEYPVFTFMLTCIVIDFFLITEQTH